MESGPSSPSNSNITRTTLDSRALCAICGAPAIGRNFDAYTCLSCKAFFRRNAYNEHLRYTCRVRNSCEITIETRRHCSACRLNKCFEKGMKKELIRSLTAINQASSAMITQQTQRLTTMDLVPSNPNQSILLINDWNIITNIRNAYENYCIEPFLSSHKIIPLQITAQPYRSRLKPQRLIDLRKKYVHILSSFLKRILQIEYLHDDSFDYLKHNIKPLLTINTSELMKSNHLEHLPWENDRILFETFLTENLLANLEKHLYTYQTFLPYDTIVVKLFLIILSLSTRTYPLKTPDVYNWRDFQPFPKDFIRLQNTYVTLLWKYIIYRFGYYDAIMYSVRFIQHFLHRQSIEHDMMNILLNRDDQGQLFQSFESAITL